MFSSKHLPPRKTPNPSNKMTHPNWIPAALYDAVLTAHSPSELPVTICVTPSSITFCRCDGFVYTHSIITPVPDVPSPLPLLDSVSTLEPSESVPPFDIDLSRLVSN